MGQIFAAVKQLRRLLSAHCPGSPHCLHAISDDGSALSKDKAYFILAHFRGSNPRLSLFALADLRADDRKLPSDVCSKDLWLLGPHFRRYGGVDHLVLF